MAKTLPVQDKVYAYYFNLPNGQEIEFIASNTPEKETHSFGYTDEKGEDQEEKLKLKDIIAKAHKVVDLDDNKILEEMEQKGS
jgi:hypothetical protein